MKSAILILLSILATLALAGRDYDDGYRDGRRDADPAETAAREAVRAERLRAKKLEECLRTSDWPGKPSRSECQGMYGQ